MININKELKDYIINNKIDISVNNIIEEILNTEGIDKNISLSIISISEEEIKKLNNEYRNINKSTDVLSFPVFEKEELNNTKLTEIELGDIFLCLDIISENSKIYETGMQRELTYMIVHGVLHLLGYDHISVNDKEIMRAKEKEILKKIGVFK